MGGRSWENMKSDCLVNIFGRLDLQSRLCDVPLVCLLCKQWHQALLHPLCWQSLVFPESLRKLRFYGSGNVNISGLIKFAVDRSQGCAKELVLPPFIKTSDLKYVSDSCPALKILEIRHCFYDNNPGFISELFVNWKSMEVFIMRSSCNSIDLLQIVSSIGVHCKNLYKLSVSNATISYEIASAIVSELSNLRCLILHQSDVQKEDLEVILRGCKHLELLHARHCEGFNEDDEKILNLASRIKDFQCEGSSECFSDDCGACCSARDD